MTPTLAPFYTFHTSSDTPALLGTQATQITRLGPGAAFDQLIGRGCTLATKPWVENHWCLILWKLAGMVALEPEKEGDPATKRWCWKEVMRQLLYRYERELNGGSRPPLRLIATQDAPASCPMVLCVSNITWSEAEVQEDGTTAEPCPQLEVTDGWYRLRARVDEPLARAIRAGTIRVGRKLAVAGARVSPRLSFSQCFVANIYAILLFFSYLQNAKTLWRSSRHTTPSNSSSAGTRRI